MGLYARVFAAAYDRMLAATEKAGLADEREALVSGASGRVLEIGAGTGLNLDHYGAAVQRLVLSEPEEPMARRLREHLGAREAEVVIAPAETMPFEDDSFDAVVSTLVLCTVGDQHAALAEARRVLVPGGRLLFLEHVRAGDERAARWQDRLDPIWKRLGHGCRCNRDTLAAITAAGFEVESVAHKRLPKAFPIVEPMIVGVARTPA